MSAHSAVILGGGLAGMAAAFELARTGWRDLVVVERAPELGGLAGSFERDGHFYPLGYHHILHRDRTLLSFLDLIGARPQVKWRRVRMLFETDGGLHDLGHPWGLLRFPMPMTDKLRFACLMLRAYAKQDWSEWEGRSARELVDTWAGPGVRARLFEPLCRLKFELTPGEVSAAWLGARLTYREGAAPFGYIPGANWTKVLCDGLAGLMRQSGIEIRTGQSVAHLEAGGGRIVAAVLDSGERLRGNVFVSALPTETYLGLVDRDETPQLPAIRYTALLSAVCAAPRLALPSFYWMNLCSRATTACAIFMLDALNPSIGGADEMCVNFVTHLNGRHRPLFRLPQDELVERYLDDFERALGCRPSPRWIQLSRIPMYSPVFGTAFRNPPARSATWSNVHFAGNFRTFPSVASTGTALQSGLDAAAEILRRRPARIAVPRPAA